MLGPFERVTVRPPQSQLDPSDIVKIQIDMEVKQEGEGEASFQGKH